MRKPDDRSDNIAKAQATLSYSCDPRFQSPGRRSWVIAPHGAIVNKAYEEQATVYAEFGHAGEGWDVVGVWRWSVKAGRGCEFRDAVYIAIAKGVAGWDGE